MPKVVQVCKELLRIDPQSAVVFNILGAALLPLGWPEAALKSCDKAIQNKPNFAEAFYNRGSALKQLGQLEQAVDSYQRAVDLQPDNAVAVNELGIVLQDLGQLQRATNSYEQAIALQPSFAKAHHNLSGLKKYQIGDAQIGLMESLIAAPEVSESDQVYLCFALARVYEDLADVDKSFGYLQRGNSLRKEELHYKLEHHSKLVANIQQCFSAYKQTVELAATAETPKQPVFIIGMPRSGTSLVEQILASHSRVHGAGELAVLDTLMSPLLVKWHKQGDSLTEDDISSLRQGYLQALDALKVPESIITDKMPHNFLWIGFILSAFPKAKIIHVIRDARATCWSIYKHYFSLDINGYAYDLEDLVGFYQLYTGMMVFWRERFPNRIYDLCYETLTENQQSETRKLLEFCDLQWQQSCLDFHQTKRAVKTASAAQVRKKIYQGSSTAWQKYEQHLQPLIAGLKNAGVTTD